MIRLILTDCSHNLLSAQTHGKKYTTRRSFIIFTTSLSLMVRVCQSNIIFPCNHGPSICPSHYLLLNQWVEFNQTCYITFPHGKGLQEQHYFLLRSSVWCPSICPSCYLLLNHWVEFNQTCYITFPHGKGVWEQHYFSTCPSGILPSVLHHPISS